MIVYRFRSIEVLLDKYHELENQTIYFASPDELNDPMEGFRDIVWDGDKIVWANFFKHYVFCLHANYLLLRLGGDSVELDVDNIPIIDRWDKVPSPRMERLSEDIWNSFLRLPCMIEIIEALANTDRKIRYRELGYYLRIIHDVLIEEIEDSHIAYGLMSDSTRLWLPEELARVRVKLELLLKLIRLEDTETRENLDDVYRGVEEQHNERRINRQLDNPIDARILRENIQLVIRDFPNKFLNEIERQLWPKWYTACFMKDCRNSSVWAHYGGKHEGVCLIFESVKIGEDDGLALYQGIGGSVRTTRFSEINYVDKPSEVDFFRSIGRLPVDLLMRQWYTDEEGNISECAAHIPGDGDMDSSDIVTWRKDYWDNFYRDITAKTKDWEYEQEYRLILEDGLRQFDEKESRSLAYDFNLLKGIIFGIKTSDENRLRIIKIIQRKCRENNRTDFKFFQAEYSPATGDICKHEIRLT